MPSQYLNRSQLSALDYIGDLMLPRNGAYPSFSELGCIEHIDVIVAYAPPDDLQSLGAVLGILAWLPGFVSRFVVRLAQQSDAYPEPLSSNLRLLDTGLRSLVISLYYSGRHGASYTGPTPLDVMGFEVSAVMPEESAA